MILEEIEHVLANIVSLLPSCGDGVDTLATTHHIAQRIVHANLIVEIVEACTKIVAILSRVINLANKQHIRIAILDLIGSPAPESSWHHLGHIATEAIDTLRCPEQQDISHLIPRVGNRTEVPHPACIVVETIVKFYGLVPVVHARRIVETIVASGFGRLFDIGFGFAMIEVEIGREALTRAIVEIVLRVEAMLRVIVLAKIFYPLGLADGVILAGHVVGHKVDDDLKTSLMGALYQCLELLHALIDIDSQIGIDIVIVGDSVRRASLALDDSRMVLGNAIGCIVGLGGMADDACVPNMAHAHRSDFFQSCGREAVHLSTSVLGQRTILDASGVAIAIEAGENLIDKYLTRCHGQKPLC